MFVQRPKFVTYTDGHVSDIFCKVCGSPIAGYQESVRGRKLNHLNQWIEERVIKWMRFSNYAELKMEFEPGALEDGTVIPGGFHVTNGCSTCLTMNLTVDQLRELHHADLEDLGENFLDQKERQPLQVVAVRTDGGGIE